MLGMKWGIFPFSTAKKEWGIQLQATLHHYTHSHFQDTKIQQIARSKYMNLH